MLKYFHTVAEVVLHFRLKPAKLNVIKAFIIAQQRLDFWEKDKLFF